MTSKECNAVSLPFPRPHYDFLHGTSQSLSEHWCFKAETYGCPTEVGEGAALLSEIEHNCTNNSMKEK